MKTLALTSLFALTATAAFAQSAPQAFVDKAASGGLYEIQSSEMVLEAEGLAPEIREFAEQMIADHTKAAADLAKAAGMSGLEVPTAPQPKEAKKLEQLAAADDMQALYLTQQNLAHNDAVVLHRSYAAAGTDDALKSYAEAALPVLEEHDGHVEMLHAEMAD